MPIKEQMGNRKNRASFAIMIPGIDSAKLNHLGGSKAGESLVNTGEMTDLISANEINQRLELRAQESKQAIGEGILGRTRGLLVSLRDQRLLAQTQ